MTRDQLEHIIRAACTIADDDELIEGAIGELSMFHETFGYYADGVGPGTATLPEGWEHRLVPVRGPGTAGNTGWALEIHDLLISKYVASRDKDLRYIRVALIHQLAAADTLRERLVCTSVDERTRTRIAAQLDADAASG